MENLKKMVLKIEVFGGNWLSGMLIIPRREMGTSLPPPGRIPFKKCISGYDHENISRWVILDGHKSL